MENIKFGAAFRAKSNQAQTAANETGLIQFIYFDKDSIFFANENIYSQKPEVFLLATVSPEPQNLVEPISDFFRKRESERLEKMESEAKQQKADQTESIKEIEAQMSDLKKAIRKNDQAIIIVDFGGSENRQKSARKFKITVGGKKLIVSDYSIIPGGDAKRGRLRLEVCAESFEIINGATTGIIEDKNPEIRFWDFAEKGSDRTAVGLVAGGKDGKPVEAWHVLKCDFCANCGTKESLLSADDKQLPDNIGSNRFCSYTCAGDWKKKYSTDPAQIVVHCARCNQEYTIKDYRGFVAGAYNRAYCSKRCEIAGQISQLLDDLIKLNFSTMATDDGGAVNSETEPAKSNFPGGDLIDQAKSFIRENKKRFFEFVAPDENKKFINLAILFARFAELQAIKLDSVWNDEIAKTFQNFAMLGEFEVLAPKETVAFMKSELDKVTCGFCGLFGLLDIERRCDACSLLNRNETSAERLKPGYLGNVGVGGNIAEYESDDSQYLSAREDLLNSRPDILKAAKEYLSFFFPGQLKDIENIAGRYADFAIQEIAEFCGFDLDALPTRIPKFGAAVDVADINVEDIKATLAKKNKLTAAAEQFIFHRIYLDYYKQIESAKQFQVFLRAILADFAIQQISAKQPDAPKLENKQDTLNLLPGIMERAKDLLRDFQPFFQRPNNVEMLAGFVASEINRHCGFSEIYEDCAECDSLLPDDKDQHLFLMSEGEKIPFGSFGCLVDYVNRENENRNAEQKKVTRVVHILRERGIMLCGINNVAPVSFTAPEFYSTCRLADDQAFCDSCRELHFEQAEIDADKLTQFAMLERILDRREALDGIETVYDKVSFLLDQVIKQTRELAKKPQQIFFDPNEAGREKILQLAKTFFQSRTQAVNLFTMPQYMAEFFIKHIDEFRPKFADPSPVEMVIFCPVCFAQHIDAPEPENDWFNPPHKSHKCKFCSAIFRIADIATTGVLRTKTIGENDTWFKRDPAKGITGIEPTESFGKCDQCGGKVFEGSAVRVPIVGGNKKQGLFCCPACKDDYKAKSELPECIGCHKRRKLYFDARTVGGLVPVCSDACARIVEARPLTQNIHHKLETDQLAGDAIAPGNPRICDKCKMPITGGAILDAKNDFCSVKCQQGFYEPGSKAKADHDKKGENKK